MPDRMKSMFFMLGWAVSVTLSVSCAKILSSEFNNHLLVMMRCFFGLLFFLPFIKDWKIKVYHPWINSLRVILVYCAMLCTYYAYRNIDLALATSIGFSGPLFTTALSGFILRDFIPWNKWLALLLGYVGVLIILWPKLVEHNLLDPKILAFIALIGANIFASSGIIATRYLSINDSITSILLFNTVGLFLLSSVFGVAHLNELNVNSTMILTAMGGLGLLSNLFYANAVKLSLPSFTSIFEYTRLLVTVPIGYFFFEEMVGIYTFFGVIVIIGSGIYILKETNNAANS